MKKKSFRHSGFNSAQHSDNMSLNLAAVMERGQSEF